MKGFLKELKWAGAIGTFDALQTGDVTLTPGKWHRVVEIRGKGKLLQANVFCFIRAADYTSAGDATWDMRILLDDEVLCELQSTGSVSGSGNAFGANFLATDITYLLPYLSGKNTVNNYDLFGNVHNGGGNVSMRKKGVQTGRICSSGDRNNCVDLLPFFEHIPFERFLAVEIAFLPTDASATFPTSKQCIGNVNIAYQLEEG